MKKIKIKTIDGKVIAESKAKDMTIKELAEKYRDELAYACLIGVDLSGVDLTDTNLFRANLSGANLFQADMRAVSLDYADLTDADLTDADLTGVDLSYSDLADADLSGVDLSGSNLTGANLSGVNLFQADLSFASLDNTKLTGIKGYSEIYEIFLELCRRQPTGTFTSKEWMIIGQLSLHHPCWDEIKRRYGKTALPIARKLAKAGWDEYYKKYKEILK